MEKGRKVVFTGKDKVEIEDFTVGRPKENEVSIKAVNSLISAGSETAVLTGTHIGFTDKNIGFPPHPFYPFEPRGAAIGATGIVTAVGKKVNELQPGNAVFGLMPHVTHAIVSVGAPGQKSAWKIPKERVYVRSCFTVLGTVALLGVKLANVKLGESVLIVGQGIVGQLALQLARLSGAAPVIVADLYGNRLDASATYGADYVINSKESDLEEEIRAITSGRGVNVVIEASGNPEVFPAALRVAGKLGRIVVLGSPRGKAILDLYTEIHRKGLSLIGAHGGLWPKDEEGSIYYPWTKQWAIGYILNLLAEGSLQVDKLVTDRICFEKASEAYRKIIEFPEHTIATVFDYQ